MLSNISELDGAKFLAWKLQSLTLSTFLYLGSFEYLSATYQGIRYITVSTFQIYSHISQELAAKF